MLAIEGERIRQSTGKMPVLGSGGWYWCHLERSHSRESGNPRGDNGATALYKSVWPRIARL
jgi:hypothetical protein